VSSRPQLEVLDAVVDTISVAMMDYLVGQERTAEMNSHHQPMFAYLGGASNQTSQGRGDRDVSIPMADVSVAVAPSDRTIRLGVAVFEEALVVGSAHALGLVGLDAIFNRAQSPSDPQWLFAHCTGA